MFAIERRRSERGYDSYYLIEHTATGVYECWIAMTLMKRLGYIKRGVHMSVNWTMLLTLYPIRKKVD